MATDTLTFQTALARLMTDPRELARFYDDPVGFGEAHALDEGQMVALQSIDRRRLFLEADALGWKRFLRAEIHFPATFALLDHHEALEEVEQRFVMTYRPIRPEEEHTSPFRDAFWFAELAGRMVDGGELDIPYLSDVLCCEHVELLLSTEPASVESASAFEARNAARPSVTREEVLDAAVRVGRHVAVKEFSCDVLPLVQALAQHEEPPTPSPVPTSLLFGKLPASERVQRARVGRMTTSFLARADGVRTTREILAEMIDPRLDRAARDATEQGCCRVLIELLGLHFVTLEEGACPTW